MTTASEKAVVVGASAGAVEALSVLLPGLPPTLPVPIVVVVHIPPDKHSVMAELFSAKCRLRVKEAEDKEPLLAGTVYFAPPDYHVLIEADKTLSLSNDEPVLYSRPSIDVLFESAADAYGAGLVAVVLSGANHDGAKGARAVIDAGGLGLIQEPETAYASAMPEAAIKACPTARVLSLSAIADVIGEI
ncbi:chemotaxis protein CheB [Rhizobium sp. SSA_523]|uniref:chemotaxis protein CheB n=1 Tax=Rhizobium sp. SSA_523 TaxID=2952477 RepID=UPI0025B042E2|nr:chemotaxis protein CheB [Rhizobium sp. SSA_523]WKC21544.1 chemotaxis protein CheB [Rhizobium sp. SSA_523]